MPTSSTSRSSSSRGFTLIEVIVTVSIVALIMGIVLTSQSKYTEGTLLNNTVIDASLVVREAQVSGVAVREFEPGTGDFNSAYGAMFQIGLDGYYFFADRGAHNGFYDNDSSCPTGPSYECLQKKSIPTGVTISQICSIALGGAETCNVGRVDITFIRPATDARFVFWDTNISQMSVSNVQGVRIKFNTPSGITKSVVVYTTGQISVQ